MELKDIKFDSARFDNHLIENRQVRIFLSSTFSDMQEERTELVKVFEILKVEAAERNVSLSVVDLRWGVTEEEAKSGKVISVCLEEIEHSHPFFIGILGNNYGTAPKQVELTKNPELKERYEWLNDVITDDENGMSITEMEIQYGVLKNNKKDIDAAFYFRKSDEPDNNKRLTKLKDEIRDYCRSKGRDDLPKDFSEVSELCDYVMEEVRNVINKHFPETKEVTLLDRERSAQKAYINSRHSSYHERKLYYDIIDEFVYDDSRQHLVFTGASGIGKSALLANWILKNEKNTNFNLIYHFVGNSFSGNNYESILRHICDEIYDLYDILRDDNRNEKIEEEAQRLVAEVSQKDKRLIIVIDGINQIVTQGPGKEKLLLWLPSANKNLKYIFSTLPEDETMKTFNRRDYRCVTINPLSSNDLNEWIPDYLRRVGKSLDKDKKQLERIVKWALSNVIQGNMLVLRTLLDELTRFGVYEKVDERINYYTSAISIPDFFDRVLGTLDNDYSHDKDLVRRALSLISVTEHGLSEDELMTILGCKDRPIEWKLFFCAFYYNLVVKNNLITFSHQYVQDAIINRYNIGDDNSEIISLREEVIHCIVERVKGESLDYRTTSELAYQYYKTNNHRLLYALLIKTNVFNVLFDARNDAQLFSYWKYLLSIESCNYSMYDYLNEDACVKNGFSIMNEIFDHLSFFTSKYFNDKHLALQFDKKRLEIFNELIIKDKTFSVSPVYAQIMHDLGIHSTLVSEKVDYLKKAIEIFVFYYGFTKDKSFIIDIADAYHNLAVVHYELIEQGDSSHFSYAKSEEQEALRWLQEAIDYYPNNELNINEKKCVMLNTYSNILATNDNTVYESLQMIKEAEKIARYLSGTDFLSSSYLAITLENKGLIMKKMPDVNVVEVEDCYIEALNLFSKLSELVPDMYLGDVADVYDKIAVLMSNNPMRRDEMIGMFNKALEIYKTCLGYSDDYLLDIARIHYNIGFTYNIMAKSDKDFERAECHLLECLSIRRKLIKTGTLQEDSLCKVLYNLFTVHQQLGMYENSMKELLEIKRIKNHK